MQFSQEHNNFAYVIKSYQSGIVRIVQPVTPQLLLEADNEPDKINELRHFDVNKSAVITTDTLIDNWPPRSVDELKHEHMEIILNLNPEVVLIGTGEHTVWPHPEIMSPLIQRGIGYEVMTTPAACRTYNVLMHEARNVAAALMI